MKLKNIIIAFIVGLLVGVSSTLLFSIFLFPQQTKGLEFSKLVDKKLNSLRQSIDALGNNLGGDLENVDKLKKFNEIKRILDTQYFEPDLISGSKMWDAALQAYVAALGDPFTVYLTAKDNQTLQKALQGKSDFEGIGAVVTKVPEGVLIEQVIKGGPAYKAGLKPLDIILQANGVDLSNLPLGEAVDKIKGPAGTEVELTIKRDGKVFKIKVKREKIVLKSVNSEVKEYKGIKLGYISISSVGADTYNEFVKQLNNLLKQGIKGIIVDLRGNGGGYLDIGYDIGAVWAKKGQIVVQTKYRNPLLNQVFKALKDGKLHGFPTVVLIDGYTASAGEIITAAIRENNPNTARLVGEKTFGKGTIQTLKQFQDGSSLKYTIGKWYTPNGENVCKKGVLPGKGIKPDVEVKFDEKLYKSKLIDTQLNKGEEVLYDLIKKKK